MSRLSVILADTDLRYIKSISNFIRTSDFSNQMAIKYFNNQQDLESYLHEESNTNLLLTTPELLPHDTTMIDTIIVLTESHKEHFPPHASLLKYQPLSSLFSSATALYYEQNRTVKPSRAKSVGTKIITLYSPIGGSGKTTIAVNLARYMANEGERVFYLNLELISSLPLFFKTDDVADSSEVFYYSKAKPEELELNIAAFIRKDQHVDYFNLQSRPEEIYETTEKDIVAILTALVNQSVYDYIIVDLDSSLDPRVLASLKMSHLTLWPLMMDVQSFHKSKVALEGYKRILKDDDFDYKIQFVLNRYLGERNMPTELNEYDLDIPLHLPYVSEWKAVGNTKTLTNHPFFIDQLKKLYHKLVEQNRGVFID